MTVRSRSRLLGWFLLAVAANIGLFAQTAQIAGKVTDTSGAVAPAATITVRNTATGAERVVKSSGSGLYTVPLLSPGAYDVSAALQGFKSSVRSGVQLQVDQHAELDFSLEVGSASETVDVTSAAPLLNTVEASQGQVIDNQRVVELPLNGRYYGDLALLSAGTVQSAPGSRLNGFSVAGQRVTQNNYLLDGIDNNSVELAGAGRRSEMVQPSVDAVQEFKVQTSSYAAEFGRAMGGVVNLTLKSGTNQLHGSAFEFLRNEKLDARNYFTPANSDKPPFKRNQYGLSLGGPVIIPRLYDGRNRTFFFGDFESTRIRETSTVVSTIPTQLMRTGDFSELLQQRNRPIRNPLTLQPFAGNIIPASQIDPVAAGLIQLYPTPLSSNLASNYTLLSPRRQDVDKWDVRIDQNVNSKDTAFFRFSRQDVNIPDTPSLPPPAYGGGNLDFTTLGYNAGAGLNHLFSPTLIASIRAGWNYTQFQRNNPASTDGQLFNQIYGIKGGNNTIPGGFSNLGLTGYRALGIGGFNPVDRNSQNRQLSGDLTWVKGKHTVKSGAGVLFSENNIFNIRNAVGNYSFNAQYTGDGAADFLLGYANSWTYNTPVNVQLRTYNLSFFVQDDWKVSDRLTFNFGVRYELSPPWLEKRNKMGIFDLDTNPGNPSLVYAAGGSRFQRALVATDKNNVMPRVGFAYKLGDKTTIRSGYGIFYAYMEPFGDDEFLIGNPPFAYGVTLAGSSTRPAFLLGNGPPADATEFSRATGLQFSSFDRYPDTSAAHQWNFNIQRQFGSDWLLETSYTGSKGWHLVRQSDGNFSVPGPGALNPKRLFASVAIPDTGIVASPISGVYSHRFDGNSSYNAFIAKLEKRFSRGFTVITSYTFSKTIGDTCGAAAQGNAAGCGYRDPRNLSSEKSVDNQDVPQRFVLSALYELPFGSGRTWGSSSNAFVKGLLGGWTVGSIITESSGLPFSAIVAGNPANIGSIDIVNRPDVLGDPYAGDRTVQQDFNINAFAANQPFANGNAGRNILRQRSFFNWDFSALKYFHIRERLQAQFRFEAFHFSNTPRFGTPGITLGAANFGTITSADTPRNLQFGLKLLW